MAGQGKGEEGGVCCLVVEEVWERERAGRGGGGSYGLFGCWGRCGSGVGIREKRGSCRLFNWEGKCVGDGEWWKRDGKVVG